jgi:hypothetical protein
MKTKNYLSLFLMTLIFLISSIGIPQEIITKNFTVKKAEYLAVKVSGDVKIESWTKDEVLVEIRDLNKDNVEDLTITREGNTVSVILKNNDGAYFNFKIPEQFNLDINTSGGDLIFTGKIVGTVSGKTAGGDISIETVQGNVILTTAGGEIKSGDISGNVTFSTAGGDLLAGNIGGDGKLSTAGGDITVSNCNKSLTLSTAGGDIKVGNAGGEVKASTSGGNITVGMIKNKAKLNTSGGDIKLGGAVGNISTNTSGGDIKLENINGSLNANTSGGEIYAELIPDGSEDSKLNTSGGNIKLLVPENAKATIEALIKVSSKHDLKGPFVITSDYKMDSYVTDEDDKEIRATINLNGGGKLIKLKTSNSKIEIKKLIK